MNSISQSSSDYNNSASHQLVVAAQRLRYRKIVKVLLTSRIRFWLIITIVGWLLVSFYIGLSDHGASVTQKSSNISAGIYLLYVFFLTFTLRYFNSNKLPRVIHKLLLLSLVAPIIIPIIALLLSRLYYYDAVIVFSWPLIFDLLLSVPTYVLYKMSR